MTSSFDKFQSIVRRAKLYTAKEVPQSDVELHPFDERNIHPEIAEVSKRLFDDGHYSQATFEAFKFLDKQVSKLSKIKASGFKLMMQAFNESSPSIKLTSLSDTSQIDEQKGYSFLFAGSVLAIRNPRGHEVGNLDSIDVCLDHLGLASLLVRRLGNRHFP
ncbi:MAG: TIGR02391 family protein [Pseudomonadota bacterium]|nr:TIGR02391 family protein [Pseudomonadota bacterium]